MLQYGIYEQVINKAINNELTVAGDKIKKTARIDEAEASGILAKYTAEIIEKGLDELKDSGRNLNDQVSLINKVISLIHKEINGGAFESLTVDERAEQLLALLDRKNSIYGLREKEEIIRPETSIAQTSLFTGAIHEPSMFSELKKEIISSDRVDMLVSFIKWSGLRLIMDELRLLTQNGGKLRIITTSYMGATDIKAIEELRKLPEAEIKISYDTKRTRLHAKTYVFHRNTGFTTAYVGSSNLSNVAISSGLEWNVKVTAKDLPETIQKIDATFESYWNSSDFEEYTKDQQARLERALKSEKYFESNDAQPYLFDILPYPYQQEILDKLEAERTVRNQYRNLIVAATGTGKTVISAFDYKRFRRENHGMPCRLLFIAHREEILKQSINCFRGVLKDANFGELFVGNYQPEAIDNLFMSIQTFNSQDWQEKTTSDFYDFIIVDEFHHAAAPTYKKLLSYYNPQILLGLTATPERMDGQNVITYFNDRIAAEIRLPEAIDRKLLCPFQYFGVSDTVNLNDLKWTRGGYDRVELSNIYTMNNLVAGARCNMIITSLFKYVTDINDVKGLGFCVSVAHAEFMSMYFNEKGIPSIALTSQSLNEERSLAKNKLVNGEVRFIFVVDLYNEGVDIPEINTVLFLRPTESLTVFLQQLGRGLRLSENKECLTVLDFIGQANKKYNFEDKFSSLLSATTKGIQREIKNGFAAVPRGCFIQLERKAKEYILNNIRSSFNDRAGLVSRIATFEEDTGKAVSIENFTEYYHLDVRNIYARSSFSRLCVSANVQMDFDEPLEEVLTKAFPRICAIDSRRWISFLMNLLDNLKTTDFAALQPVEASMLRMFYSTIWQDSAENLTADAVRDNLHSLSDSKIMLSEIKELLTYNYNHIDFIDEPVEFGYDSPLDLHCSYTRDQILLALEFMKPKTVREGVKWLPDRRCDVFFVTLNKADKEYSPSTMYDDYSINEWLFHWQSQSTTSEHSPTGQRYIHHKDSNSNILIFVREFKADSAGAAPYTFLGLADYLKHEGSRPMSITWKLRRPIPAKYLKKTNKLIVG